MLDRLLENPAYQRLSDKDKAEAVSLAYAYASVRGKQSVSDYRIPESSWVRGAMSSILPTDLYILYWINADRDHNGSVSGVESAQTLNRLGGLTDSQRGRAWAEKNSTTSDAKNPFTGALVNAGASVETSIDVLNRYRELDADKSMSARERAAAFKRYVRGLGLTPEQMKAVKSAYTYYSAFPLEW